MLILKDKDRQQRPSGESNLEQNDKQFLVAKAYLIHIDGFNIVLQIPLATDDLRNSSNTEIIIRTMINARS